MKKQIAFLILILATAVVVSGCNKKPQQPQGNQVQNQNNQENNYVSTSTSEIEGWATYYHKGLGLEVSLPEDFYVTGQSKNNLSFWNKPEEFRNEVGSISGFNNLISFGIGYSDELVDSNNIDFCKREEEKFESKIEKCEKVIINGENYTKITATELMGHDYIKLRSIKNNYIFGAGGTNLTYPTKSNYTKEEVRDLLTKILSTIKFID